MSSSSSCPSNSFRYNGTLCACNPGYYGSGSSCAFLNASLDDWQISSGVVSSSTLPNFLTTVLPLDSIKKLTQFQAVLLEATFVLLLLWLLFCFLVRFGKVDGGRSIWFRIRWWISRLDFAFSTQHWLDDQKVVHKRKTELGGTFSVASWILFVGLLSALLYQIITERTIEVHKVRPVNAPDLLSFVNDMEFNITTISSMSCAHLHGLDTLVLGTPGFVDYKVFPLSTYANYYCQNTSNGPTISLKCNSCQIPRRNYFISWQFVDLPNDPAMAVGFQFKLTAKDHGNNKYVSFVSGTLQSDSYMNDKPRTFRGPDLNILKIRLFPQIYNNLHNLKLIQPLFHDFIPGSYCTNVSDLQSSLQRPQDGLINTTLDISHLSDYIVEIDKENVMGPVSVLANAGGLYAVCIGIFLYLLLQCEARIKKLRNEDRVMRDIRSQRRAQHNWDKLRKYVVYTWGPTNMDVKNINAEKHGSLRIGSFCGIESMHKMKQSSRMDSLHLDMLVNGPNDVNVAQDSTLSGKDKSIAADTTVNMYRGVPISKASGVNGQNEIQMCE